MLVLVYVGAQGDEAVHDDPKRIGEGYCTFFVNNAVYDPHDGKHKVTTPRKSRNTCGIVRDI